MKRLFSEAWRDYRCFLLCWEPVAPGNCISRWAGPMADWVLLPCLWYRNLNGHRRISRVFQGSLRLTLGVWGSKTRHACSHSSLSQPRSHSPQYRPAVWGSLWRTTAPCVVVAFRSGWLALWASGGPPRAHTVGRQAAWPEEKVRPCLRWEDVMTRCPRAAGTQAFKKLRKQPLSKQWLPWRKAHPGLTFKKPNCLLQREKATSCHRPCSGKNVSGLTVAVRAMSAQVGAGSHQPARDWEDVVVLEAPGLSGSPTQGSAGVKWVREPSGKTNLSEVMLIFQASVPRWDSSSRLRSEAWITVVRRGQFMIHKTKSQMWHWFGAERGRPWGPLHAWLYFSQRAALQLVVQFPGPVPLWVT